jgi:hypothetical protein
MASPTIDRPIHQRRRARGNDQVEAQPQVDWVDTVAADQDHRLTQAAACLEQALDGDVAPACTAAVGGSGATPWTSALMPYTVGVIMTTKTMSGWRRRVRRPTRRSPGGRRACARDLSMSATRRVRSGEDNGNNPPTCARCGRPRSCGQVRPSRRPGKRLDARQ